jgi:Flp pilus assembly protein TadD
MVIDGCICDSAWNPRRDQAREHHTQALAIAGHIGAAPEQARALEGLGHTHLQDGNPGHAAAHLQQALVIYQRIGALGN